MLGMESEDKHGTLKDVMIFQKTRTTNLKDVRQLNMWGYELFDVSIVSKLVNVEILSFPINQIKTLEPFQYCTKLKSLLLRQNLISDFSELRYLQNLPNLTSLTLMNNPISLHPNYRETVIQILPQIQLLDDIKVQSTQNLNKTISPSASIKIPPKDNDQPQRKSMMSLNMKSLLIKQKEKEETRKSFSNFIPNSDKITNHQNNNNTDDSHFLTAVLSLIPELSVDSLQIVLTAIHDRCM